MCVCVYMHGLSIYLFFRTLRDIWIWCTQEPADSQEVSDKLMSEDSAWELKLNGWMLKEFAAVCPFGSKYVKNERDKRIQKTCVFVSLLPWFLVATARRMSKLQRHNNVWKYW